MDVLDFDIKNVTIFCRKSYLKFCYYKMKEELTLSQLIFESGGKQIIEKLSKKTLLEIPDYLEQYFNSSVNAVLDSDGIIFYIDELQIDNTNEIERLKRLRVSIMTKLENSDFISKAPPKMVELEKQKLKDTDDKINNLITINP